MRNLWLLVFWLFAPGCAIVAHSPMNRFESPEVQGRGGGFEGFVGYQSRTDMQLTPDFELQAPSLSDPSVEQPSHRIMAEGALGLGRHWDIELSVPEARVGGKYQIFGQPRNEATQGNFSLSVYFGVSWTKDDQQEDVAFTTTGQQTKFEVQQTQEDLGLVAGYRIADNLLFYGGPFLVWNGIHSTFTPPSSASFVSDATALSVGLNLGLQLNFSSEFFVRGEISGTKTRLGNAHVGRESEGVALGLNL